MNFDEQYQVSKQVNTTGVEKLSTIIASKNFHLFTKLSLHQGKKLSQDDNDITVHSQHIDPNHPTTVIYQSKEKSATIMTNHFVWSPNIFMYSKERLIISI